MGAGREVSCLCSNERDLLWEVECSDTSGVVRHKQRVSYLGVLVQHWVAKESNFKPMERSSNIQIRGSLIHDALLKYSSLVSRMCYRLLVACEKKKTASRGGVVGRGARPGCRATARLAAAATLQLHFVHWPPLGDAGGLLSGGYRGKEWRWSHNWTPPPTYVGQRSPPRNCHSSRVHIARSRSRRILDFCLWFFRLRVWYHLETSGMGVQVVGHWSGGVERGLVTATTMEGLRWSHNRRLAAGKVQHFLQGNILIFFALQFFP